MNRSSVYNLRGNAGDPIIGEIHFPHLVADADADASSCCASFSDGVSDKANVFGFTCDFNCGTVIIAAVFDDVVFNYVTIGLEVETSVFVAKQDAELAAVANLILPHDVVGVVMADRNAVQFIAVDDVVFCQTVFDAPAPENALTVTFQPIASNDGPL